MEKEKAVRYPVYCKNKEKSKFLQSKIRRAKGLTDTESTYDMLLISLDFIIHSMERQMRS